MTDHYCGCCINRKDCDCCDGGVRGPFEDACVEHDCDGLPVVDDDTCGLCGAPGADKKAGPRQWPGETVPATNYVHAECEAAECARAFAAHNADKQRRIL